jgi:alcohol dehydrogenase
MPEIVKATDAVVRVTKTTICGTDLHILKGDLPSVTAERILGHEGVGVVGRVGDGVSSFKAGDEVIISCVSACGRCENCKKGMPSHCQNGGGWILGYEIDGTQAEYVRIPFADNSLYAVAAGLDREALVLVSDILPTRFECGVLNGRIKPGDTVAIIGAGPVGLPAREAALHPLRARVPVAGGHAARTGRLRDRFAFRTRARPPHAPLVRRVTAGVPHSNRAA